MRVEQHPILEVGRQPDTYILYEGKRVYRLSGQFFA